jgi:hypothetical protein
MTSCKPFESEYPEAAEILSNIYSLPPSFNQPDYTFTYFPNWMHFTQVEGHELNHQSDIHTEADILNITDSFRRNVVRES